MNKMKQLIIAFLFCTIYLFIVSALFSIGESVWILYNSNYIFRILRFNNENSLTRFSGGLTAEYMFAQKRFGCGLSLMHASRGEKLGYIPDPDMNGPGTPVVFTRDYIDIPVNFIWRITRNGLLNPYLFMGPVLGFNTGNNKNWILISAR